MTEEIRLEGVPFVTMELIEDQCRLRFYCGSEIILSIDVMKKMEIDTALHLTSLICWEALVHKFKEHITDIKKGDIWEPPDFRKEKIN